MPSCSAANAASSADNADTVAPVDASSGPAFARIDASAVAAFRSRRDAYSRSCHDFAANAAAVPAATTPAAAIHARRRRRPSTNAPMSPENPDGTESRPASSERRSASTSSGLA
ncbi:MAG: hypothetical protein HMLKMBBP_00631 [Planctomycetes bacterium]|nr:hypothetical protein [Planctomycetota bacterium]